MNSKKLRARCPLFFICRRICENSDGEKPEGWRERMVFHRDLERWCVRMETTVGINWAEGGGEGEAEAEKAAEFVLGI